MIKEISARPTPQNKNAKIGFLIFLLLSAVAFVTYYFIDRYKGVVGLVGLMALTTGILIYTKYISVQFYYDVVIDSGNNPMFVVRQLIGRRVTTLCRIDLADIIDVKHEGKNERRAHKTARGVRQYVYAPTLFPKETYRLTVKSRYENAEIIIEGTGEFASLLSEYSKEARELLSADGE